MNTTLKKIIYSVILTALSVLLVLIIVWRSDGSEEPAEPSPSLMPTVSLTPTPSASPSPTAEQYTLTFVGDNTIANSNLAAHFDKIVRGDMNYCYKNIRQYFENDDMTFGNLECILSDSSLSSSSMFHFKAPTKNAEMLKNAGFEYMTTANNHTLDYGAKGLEDTLASLDSYGIAHGTDGKYGIFETESGLKTGIYCGSRNYSMTKDRAQSIVSELKAQGAEFIIFALHWGNEGEYHPTGSQTRLAHNYIDAGVDLVYGSHPHVLQPVEEYNGGLIIYSMGNFCFGGNSGPRDMDSAVVQVKLERNTEGRIVLSDYTLIPCRISSVSSYNDYCPTPYEEGTKEYDRVLSKLDGSYEGADLIPDYSWLETPSPSPEVSPSQSPEQSAKPIISPEPSGTPTQEPSPSPSEVIPTETPERSEAPETQNESQELFQ